MELFNCDDKVLVLFNYAVDMIRMNPITVAGLLACLKLAAKKTKSTEDDKILTMLSNMIKKVFAGGIK